MSLADWGAALKEAASSAAAGAVGIGQSAGEVISAAGQKAAVIADAAAKKAAQWGVASYHAAVDTAHAAQQKATDSAIAAYETASDMAKHAAASAVLTSEHLATSGAGAVGSAVGTAKQLAGPLASKAAGAFQKVKQYFDPAQPVLIPCIPCMAKDTTDARAKRIVKRNELIAQSETDPALKDKAAELKGDMVAVEMARLSDNTYSQSYVDPPKPAAVPVPWQVMSDNELKAAGIDPALLRESKAVVYQCPDNFPFNPKTVLAFRGTTSETQDILSDHDQALGLKTTQYTAAKELGREVADAFPGAEVTGHSLGGGKAQAAGVAGNLDGMMFNSAGLHPDTVNMTPEDLAAQKGRFLQYRAEGGITKGGGDPLTGIQNSPTMQKAAYGLAKGLKSAGQIDAWAREVEGVPSWTESVPAEHQEIAKELSDRVLHVTADQAARNYELSGGKWYIPPAVGDVRGVTSKNADGTDTPLADQHSIKGLVNGFEFRKFNNISDLLKATGTNGNPASYLGPTEVEMR